jgi:uncharacterized protein (DUF4415 family)
MPINSKTNPTPLKKRRGIKIDQNLMNLYEKRSRDLDKAPDSAPLHPDQWANAMRRDEFFRPIKKQTTVRLDSDVLAWLKSKGTGHLTRINEILRRQMIADLRK